MSQHQSNKLTLLRSSRVLIPTEERFWGKRGKYFFTGNGLRLANPSLQKLGCAIHKGKTENFLIVQRYFSVSLPVSYNPQSPSKDEDSNRISLCNCSTRRLRCEAVLRPLPVLKESFQKVNTDSLAIPDCYAYKYKIEIQSDIHK